MLLETPIDAWASGSNLADCLIMGAVYQTLVCRVTPHVSDLMMADRPSLSSGLSQNNCSLVGLGFSLGSDIGISRSASNATLALGPYA